MKNCANEEGISNNCCEHSMKAAFFLSFFFINFVWELNLFFRSRFCSIGIKNFMETLVCSMYMFALDLSQLTVRQIAMLGYLFNLKCNTLHASVSRHLLTRGLVF